MKSGRSARKAVITLAIAAFVGVGIYPLGVYATFFYDMSLPPSERKAWKRVPRPIILLVIASWRFQQPQPAVDSADYIVWGESFGATGFELVADGNSDLRIDQADFDIFRTNFGSAVGQSIGMLAVPEADTWALLAIAILLTQLALARFIQTTPQTFTTCWTTKM